MELGFRNFFWIKAWGLGLVEAAFKLGFWSFFQIRASGLGLARKAFELGFSGFRWIKASGLGFRVSLRGFRVKVLKVSSGLRLRV